MICFPHFAHFDTKYASQFRHITLHIILGDIFKSTLKRNKSNFSINFRVAWAKFIININLGSCHVFSDTIFTVGTFPQWFLESASFSIASLTTLLVVASSALGGSTTIPAISFSSIASSLSLCVAAVFLAWHRCKEGQSVVLHGCWTSRWCGPGTCRTRMPTHASPDPTWVSRSRWALRPAFHSFS